MSNYVASAPRLSYSDCHWSATGLCHAAALASWQSWQSWPTRVGIVMTVGGGGGGGSWYWWWCWCWWQQLMAGTGWQSGDLEHFLYKG